MARPARDGPVESCALARLAFKRADEMVALGSGARVVSITALSIDSSGATAEEEGWIAEWGNDFSGRLFVLGARRRDGCLLVP